jgi:hypothetical protein
MIGGLNCVIDRDALDRAAGERPRGCGVGDVPLRSSPAAISPRPDDGIWRDALVASAV